MSIYWLEQTEPDVPIGDAWLGDTERKRLAAIRFPKRRADWRLGRWTAKLAIAEYLDVPAAHRMLSRIEILAAPSGAPRVYLGHTSAGIAISISHSSGTAAVAVSESDLTFGCDLEKVEPRSAAFVDDYFTPEEQSFLIEAPFSDRTRLTNLIWSAKESTLKALEEGLRLDTRSVTITFDSRQLGSENGWYPLWARAEGGRFFNGWYQCSDDFVRTFVGTPQPEAPFMLALGPRADLNRAAM